MRLWPSALVLQLLASRYLEFCVWTGGKTGSDAMAIERKDPANIHGFATRAEAERYCDQDLLIRSGMCPNGHGLLQFDGEWQECSTCGFSTNSLPELVPQ